MTMIDEVRLGFNPAGLCLLPTRCDGSKSPDVSSWSAFQTTRPSVAQMRGWDFATRNGVGMVAGAVSGFRECWDFDCADIFEQFVVAAKACELGDVVSRIRAGYEDETPGGGRRWIVTYPETVLRQITENVTGFFEVLAEWSRADRLAPVQDSGGLCASDGQEARHER